MKLLIESERNYSCSLRTIYECHYCCDKNRYTSDIALCQNYYLTFKVITNWFQLQCNASTFFFLSQLNIYNNLVYYYIMSTFKNVYDKIHKESDIQKYIVH